MPRLPRPINGRRLEDGCRLGEEVAGGNCVNSGIFVQKG